MQVLPQQIETHFCMSPIPPDLFDSPRVSTDYMSLATTEASSQEHLQNNNQTHGVQDMNYIMEPPKIELPPWMMDDIQLDLQPYISIQSAIKMTKKYTFFVEVGDIIC
jgi:hypothetical protein